MFGVFYAQYNKDMKIVGDYFKVRDINASRKKEAQVSVLNEKNVIVTCPGEHDEPVRFRELLCNVYTNEAEFKKEFKDSFYDKDGKAKTVNGFTFQSLPNFDIRTLTPYMGKAYLVTKAETYSRTTSAGITYNNLHKYELKEIKL